MGQALDIAAKMRAKFTMLSHFSARYPRIPVLSDRLLEAKTVGIAMDHMRIPFNKRFLAPPLLPLFRTIFEKEQTDYAFRTMQRNLRPDALDEAPPPPSASASSTPVDKGEMAISKA